MKFTAQDCQQCATDGSRVVSIHPGPFIVRVHEATDVQVHGTPHRYFISVDFKYRERDALRDWTWMGNTKAETTKDANALCAKLAQVVRSLEAAPSCAMSDGNKAVLVQRLNAELSKLLGRYSCEVEVTGVR